MKLIEYDDSFNQLNQEEKSLLQDCVISVQRYVRQSAEINKTKKPTRNVHAMSYGLLQGEFVPNPDSPEFFKKLFPNEKYKAQIRFSHSNPGISKQNENIPAFGLALQIHVSNEEDCNLPLINFPLFPIKSVAAFLKFFTALNDFLSAKNQSFWKRARLLGRLIWHGTAFIPHLFGSDMRRNLWNLLRSRNNFILSFDYHSIGAYRLGNRMVKYRLRPKSVPVMFQKDLYQDERIANYLRKDRITYQVQIQVCENLQDQPINDLTVEWKNANYVNVASLQIPSQHISPSQNEAIGFNPFHNPEKMLPVGKIQRIRKEVYDASILARNTSI
ncbi:MAG: catalase [Weeksellaceae bacterium]|nr:catalase [Weeksellaceae bacterium]